jgi:malonate transporter and related proteins
LSVVLDSVIPLFAVVFVGYFAGRARFLSEAGVKALVAFVFNFAMPPFLFRLMAETDLAEIAQWAFVGAYSLAALIMFVVGSAAGAVLFNLRPAGLIIQGFGSAFANGVLLGLPLLLWLFGEQGAVPALLIITLDVILFGLVTVMLELARSGRATGAHRVVGRTVRAIALNPIIMATFAGILFGLSGLALPGVVERTLGFIGQAAPPTALFALGATLSLRQVAGNLGPAGVMVAFKLFLHPFVVWLLVTQVIVLEPFWANAAVIFSAGPVGANVFIFAQHYEAGVEAASSAIVISTGFAMLTISVLLLMLQPIAP